jgi:hypothetical protein
MKKTVTYLLRDNPFKLDPEKAKFSDGLLEYRRINGQLPGVDFFKLHFDRKVFG